MWQFRNNVGQSVLWNNITSFFGLSRNIYQKLNEINCVLFIWLACDVIHFESKTYFPYRARTMREQKSSPRVTRGLNCKRRGSGSKCGSMSAIPRNSSFACIKSSRAECTRDTSTVGDVCAWAVVPALCMRVSEFCNQEAGKALGRHIVSIGNSKKFQAAIFACCENMLGRGCLLMKFPTYYIVMLEFIIMQIFVVVFKWE